MADDDNFDEAERRFERQYYIIGTVGEGAFGRVRKARCNRTGEIVALKQMKFDSREEGLPCTAIREIALLKELSHPNVVRLQDVFCRPNKLVLVFEFLGYDLRKYMEGVSRGFLNPPMVKNFAFQLCRGMEFCHAHGIIHRDIKPQNILIDGQLHLKIADFGLARAFIVPVPKYTHEVVTLWYRPPEILLGCTLYSVPVDMWSIGCVFAEMASGAPLFRGDSEIDTIFKIFQNLGTPCEKTWPGVSELPDFKPTFPKWPARGWNAIRNVAQQIGTTGVNLLEQFMEYDPKRRISARRALQHAYFEDVDQSNLE